MVVREDADERDVRDDDGVSCRASIVCLSDGDHAKYDDCGRELERDADCVQKRPLCEAVEVGDDGFDRSRSANLQC